MYRVLIIFLFLTFSCKSTSLKPTISEKLFIQNPLQNEKFIQIMDNVCLTGQGRGKIEIDEESNSFSYQSILELIQSKSNWTIGFIIPFKGMHTIKLFSDESDRFHWFTKSKEILNSPFLLENSLYYEFFHLQSLGEFLNFKSKKSLELSDKWEIYFQDDFLVWSNNNESTHESILISIEQLKGNYVIQTKSKFNKTVTLKFYPSSCNL